MSTLIGFRLDIGLGATSDVFARDDPELAQYRGLALFWSHIEQAFATWSVPSALGFLLDLGKFDTPVGLEDNASPTNWNYSRSLLFTWAEPSLHMGLRLTLQPIQDKLGLSLFWVNGWDANIEDGNGMRSFAGAVTWRPHDGIEWTTVYMGGLERQPTALSNPALTFRNLVDTYVVYSPSSRVSFAVTADYGHDQKGSGTNWGGVSGYVQGHPVTWLKGTLRAEVYADPEGFTTGTRQLVGGVTGTLDATIPAGRASLVARLEYRHDQSNALVFEAALPRERTFQDTLALALIAGM